MLIEIMGNIVLFMLMIAMIALLLLGIMLIIKLMVYLLKMR